MISRSGRYVIVYNGEIYNFQDIREKLKGEIISWRGHSDTEVILAAIEAWGLKKSVDCFIGMFAFALWDRTKRILYLVRDRLGVKPLYYGWINRTFMFGSELKALKAYPGFKQPINIDSVVLFLRFNCIPSPYSIYEGVFKLNPGSIEKLSWQTKKLTIESYWSVRSVFEKGVKEPFNGSEEEAIEQLEQLLRDAIQRRMISDVPLGAFL